MKRCLFLVLLLIAPFASAQNSHGSITGQVTDPTGAIIPKAHVTVTNTDTGATTNVTAGGSGFYTAPELPPGPYQVGVQAPGFKDFVQTGIRLETQENATVNV